MRYAKLFIRLLKSSLFLFYVLLFKRCNKNSDACLIIKLSNAIVSWLVSDSAVKDRAAYRALRKSGFNVCVFVNPSLENLSLINKPYKVAWINPYRKMFGNLVPELDFNNVLTEYVEKLQKFSVQFYPDSKDLKFWENKKHLHEFLRDSDINHPSTIYIDDPKSIVWSDLNYPLIVKSINGYSSNGIWLLKSINDPEIENIKKLPAILLQEFLDITFDIRVICVFGVVVSFYWRVNARSPTWKPTATQNGARVQFCGLPVSVEDLAKSIYTKTGCVTYGADICFKQDDIESKPYLLEFSPIYQPNPTPRNGLITSQYGDFKKNSIFQYEHKFEEIVVDIFKSILTGFRKKLG